MMGLSWSGVEERIQTSSRTQRRTGNTRELRDQISEHDDHRRMMFGAYVVFILVSDLTDQKDL